MKEAQNLSILLARRSSPFFTILVISGNFTLLHRTTNNIVYPIFLLDITLIDPAVQQSHSELLRRIEAVEDKFERRIRSLKAQTGERVNYLDARMNLLDRRLLSMGTRIDSLDRYVEKSNERIKDIESRTVKKHDEAEQRLVQMEDKWQRLTHDDSLDVAMVLPLSRT